MIEERYRKREREREGERKIFCLENIGCKQFDYENLDDECALHSECFEERTTDSSSTDATLALNADDYCLWIRMSQVQRYREMIPSATWSELRSIPTEPETRYPFWYFDLEKKKEEI